MKCPKCNYEPRSRLLHTPCPQCKYVWWDTESYVYELSKKLDVETVLDIGCGNKGVIAQHHWEHWPIKRGYACDIHVIKPLPPVWTPLKMDAAGLAKRLGRQSVDFVTHCGMLEHVDYAHALTILEVLEYVAKKRVFFTCSAILREVDYKVRRDNNPFHYYKSFWDPYIFQLLGYHVDLARMLRRQTFTEEITGWFNPSDVTADKFPREDILRYIRDRRCHVQGCRYEPVGWDVDSGIFCLQHARPGMVKDKGPIQRWIENEDRRGEFPYPPGRDPLPLLKE